MLYTIELPEMNSCKSCRLIDSTNTDYKCSVNGVVRGGEDFRRVPKNCPLEKVGKRLMNE